MSGKPYQVVNFSILTYGNMVSFQGRIFGDLSVFLITAAEIQELSDMR